VKLEVQRCQRVMQSAGLIAITVVDVALQIEIRPAAQIARQAPEHIRAEQSPRGGPLIDLALIRIALDRKLIAVARKIAAEAELAARRCILDRRTAVGAVAIRTVEIAPVEPV